MTQEINVHYLKDTFYLEDIEYPLKNNVYVIDNYLNSALHHAVDNYLNNAAWQKTNQVTGNTTNRGGLPNHSLWGCSFFRNEDMSESDSISKNYPPHIVRFLDRKIRTDFGFEWVRFQYAGGNSQTMGQHGTSHQDCNEDNDWNLSFLYYTNKFWNPNWGGRLRMYSENVQTGSKEEMDKYEIGSVGFAPNRLLMFDGRIPHGAEAPSYDAQYIDRRSIVIRGDEIQLLDSEQRYANH